MIGNGVCPHASLLVVVPIARSFQKRSRRDLAVLGVLETVNAASGNFLKQKTQCISGFADSLPTMSASGLRVVSANGNKNTVRLRLPSPPYCPRR